MCPIKANRLRFINLMKNFRYLNRLCSELFMFNTYSILNAYSLNRKIIKNDKLGFNETIN